MLSKVENQPGGRRRRSRRPMQTPPWRWWLGPSQPSPKRPCMAWRNKQRQHSIWLARKCKQEVPLSQPPMRVLNWSSNRFWVGKVCVFELNVDCFAVSDTSLYPWNLWKLRKDTVGCVWLLMVLELNFDCFAVSGKSSLEYIGIEKG